MIGIVCSGITLVGLYNDLKTFAKLSPYTDSSHSHTQPNGVSVTW